MLTSSSRPRSAFVALFVFASTLTPLGSPALASTTVTQTFGYSGATQTFTVPEGITSLTVTLTGGQGGQGGGDSQEQPTPGGYRGVVTGTIPVTPGQVLTLAVGSGGGTGVSSRGHAPGGSAGQNPLAGYNGAVGGVGGPARSGGGGGGSGAAGPSGGGGGSGAATVLRIDGADVVAAGAGGNGGNGQFLPIVGHRAQPSHTPRPDLTTTSGRPGMNTIEACSPGFRCHGGASGAGGAGVQGGERGDVQYDATASEYFGFGGYPGQNGTGGFGELSASYEYYAANSAAGSMVISYDSGTPGAPTSVAGTPTPGAVDLTWTAPASTGSAPITDYIVEFATNAGGPYTVFADGTSPSTSTTVTGLTNGTTYYFRVSAVNSFGTGPSSSAMTTGVMASDVPEAPTIDDVEPFDSGLYVDVTPGAADSPVTGYQVSVDGGAWTGAPATGNRITIAGLTNGTLYSVVTRAVNVVGPSAASNSVSGIPRAVPSAPSALQATADDGRIDLDWDAPAADNGSAITDYRIQIATSAGGPYSTVADGVSTVTFATLTGLDNGTTYYVRVAAVNGAGTGSYTAPIGATPYTTPVAPSIDTVTPGDGSLTVATSLAFDGGAAVTRYEYRLDGAGSWRSTGTLDEVFVISGLTNGISYAVTVRAVNDAGTGPVSDPVSGAPRTVPSAPAISTVALDTGAVAVNFTLGSSGGSAITNLEYSIDGGDSWVTRSPASTAGPVTIGGLTGGETYSIVLRAVNAVGPSEPSNQSSVTAKGTPDGPSITGITPLDEALSVSFDPGANGGTAITNYEYSIDGGGSWTTLAPASTSTTIVIRGLTNGSSYEVQVRAVNAVGSGAPSATVAATAYTTPGAPSIGVQTINGVDGALDIAFTAPTDDGGSTITTYQYSTDAGATWETRDTGTTGSPLIISTLSTDGTTPLEGGETYPVKIRAVNAAGPGAASAVADGITTTAPNAPVITAITAGDASAAVSFAVPANGGAEITAYEYRLNGGSWIDTGSLSGSFTITSLTNSQTYSVEMRATNAVGTSAPSAPVNVTIRTTPGAPTVNAVTASDGTLSVDFSAPADDGGGAITTYQYSTDGGTTWRTRTSGSTGSPLTIGTESGAGAPLANGTVYVVQIRAVNGAGSGEASNSTLVAPRGVPGALASVVLVEGDEKLSVTFTPGSDGGSSITALEYRLDGGAWVDAGSLTSPLTVSDLTNGTRYDLQVRAVNAIGAGPATAVLTGTPRTVPGVPRNVVASGTDSAVAVSWTTPLDDGGDAIDSYVTSVYTAPDGGSAVASCTTATTSCTVTGLDNGATYYLAVAATNDAGSGPASGPRVAVTPRTTPTVAIASLTPGATDIVVDLDTDNGGAAIITYEYRLDGGAWVSLSSGSEPFTIGGLTTGTSYSVEVRAVNDAGPGPASSAVSATPRTMPGAPTGLTATGGDRIVALVWTAPADNGGDPISDYVVQFASGGSGVFTTFADGTSTDTSALVTGLTNGTEYTFRVAAVNAAGTSTSSSIATATPLTVPSAPTLTGITTGTSNLQIAFTSPVSTGGSPITGYQYQLDSGEWRNAVATSSPITISGLTNGHTYQVALRAVSAVGEGNASNVLSATPVGVPSAVTGFVATPGSNSVVLSWDPVNDNGSPITAYNIIHWSAATEGSIVASYTTTDTTRTIELDNGTYYFTIEATNALGTGPRTSPRTSATVGATVPAAPTLESLTVVDGAAEIDWTNGAAGTTAISGYVVQYVPEGGAHVTLVTATSTATATTVELPASDERYSLRVASHSASGLGAFLVMSPPLVETGGVAEVASRTASVSGVVDANASSTLVGFEYATDADDLGTPAADVVAATPATAEGTGETAISASLSGLTPGTTYHVRAVGSNSPIVVAGRTSSFTTAASLTTTGLSQTYDSEPVEIVTVTEPEGLTVTRSYEGAGDTVYPSTAVAPTAAGTYTVVSSVDDGLLRGTEVTLLTIETAPLTIDASVNERPFDGTDEAVLRLDLDGVIDDDDVSLDPAAVIGTYDSADVGNDRVITISTISSPIVGTDAVNYAATWPAEISGSISRAGQTLAFATSAPDPFEIGDEYDPVVSSTAGRSALVSLSGGTDGACEVIDGTVHALAIGMCVIVASESGDANVEAATPVAQVLTVVEPTPDTDPDNPDTDDPDNPYTDDPDTDGNGNGGPGTDGNNPDHSSGNGRPATNGNGYRAAAGAYDWLEDFLVGSGGPSDEDATPGAGADDATNNVDSDADTDDGEARDEDATQGGPVERFAAPLSAGANGSGPGGTRAGWVWLPAAIVAMLGGLWLIFGRRRLSEEED